jgi:hypothetical protein
MTRRHKRDLIKVPNPDGKTPEQLQTEVMLSPIASNALSLRDFSKPSFPRSDATQTIALLADAAAKVTGGDLSDLEAMLTAQAYALNAAFGELARIAAHNMDRYPDATENYMRLALRAQAQCCRTVEALAEIKNPRSVAFVQQANIAQGPQQVNNKLSAAGSGAGAGARPCPCACAAISQDPPNELLGMTDGKRLDTGAASAASGTDRVLATVAAFDRAEDRGRESG